MSPFQQRLTEREIKYVVFANPVAPLRLKANSFRYLGAPPAAQ